MQFAREKSEKQGHELVAVVRPDNHGVEGYKGWLTNTDSLGQKLKRQLSNSCLRVAKFVSSGLKKKKKKYCSGKIYPRIN